MWYDGTTIRSLGLTRCAARAPLLGDQPATPDQFSHFLVPWIEFISVHVAVDSRNSYLSGPKMLLFPRLPFQASEVGHRAEILAVSTTPDKPTSETSKTLGARAYACDLALCTMTRARELRLPIWSGVSRSTTFMR